MNPSIRNCLLSCFRLEPLHPPQSWSLPTTSLFLPEPHFSALCWSALCFFPPTTVTITSRMVGLVEIWSVVSGYDFCTLNHRMAGVGMELWRSSSPTQHVESVAFTAEEWVPLCAFLAVLTACSVAVPQPKCPSRTISLSTLAWWDLVQTQGTQLWHLGRQDTTRALHCTKYPYGSLCSKYLRYVDALLLPEDISSINKLLSKPLWSD